MLRCLRPVAAFIRFCFTGDNAIIFAQTGPTKPLHGLDKPETFLHLLVDAVDREAARKDMQRRLQEVEGQISGSQKAIDHLHSCVTFFKSIVAEVPTLAAVIQTDSELIEQHRADLTSRGETKTLLKRRMMQWQHQQHALMKQLYDIVDVFLHALDHTGDFRGTNVSKEFASNLRTAANCSRSIEIVRNRLMRTRQQLLGRYRKRQRAARRFHGIKRLQESQEALDMQCKYQQERESLLLEKFAHPFLVDAGLIFVPRRWSDASSKSSVTSIGIHPDRSWSGVQGLLETVDDGVQHETEELESWLHARGSVLTQRTALQNFTDEYADRLAYLLYAYPNATQAEHDVLVEQDIEMDPYENVHNIQRELLRREHEYEEARRRANDAGVQDRPLTADWAGCYYDVDPSQGSSFIYRTQNTDVEAKKRRIQRWNRQLARSRPFGEAGGKRRPSPPPLSPSYLCALQSPSLRSGSFGAVESTLSPQARRRRVRHMSAIAADLRRQFQIVGGPQYTIDTRPTQ